MTMDECSKCKYRKPCEQLNFLDVANDCDDLRKFVDGIRVKAIDECIESIKNCYTCEIIMRLEQLKEKNEREMVFR